MSITQKIVFNGHNVSQQWSITLLAHKCFSLCVYAVNAANVFCVKPIFSHLRLLTSKAQSTDQCTFYLHVICACWLQVDRLAARYTNVNTFANNGPQGIKLTTFYLSILSCSYLLLPFASLHFDPLGLFFSHSLSLEFIVLMSLQLFFSHLTPRELSYLFLHASPSPAPLTRCQPSSVFQLHHYIIIIMYKPRTSLFNCRASIVSGRQTTFCLVKSLPGCFQFVGQVCVWGDKQQRLLFPESHLLWVGCYSLYESLITFGVFFYGGNIFTSFFFLEGIIISCFPYDSSGLNLPQILIIKAMCAAQFVLWKAPILPRTLNLN